MLHKQEKINNAKEDHVEKVEEIFNLIYEAAKEKEIEPFTKLGMDFITLSGRQSLFSLYSLAWSNYLSVMVDGLTPIEKLALEGDIESVNFLLARGARGAEAISGYAMNGSDDCNHEIIALLGTDKSPNDTLAQKRALHLIGLAKGGRKEQVEKFLGKSPADQEPIIFPVEGDTFTFSLTYLAALGYAAGGHHDEVDALLTSNIEVGSALIGYCVMDNEMHARRLMQANTQGYMSTQVMMTQMMIGYAAGGHVKKSQEILDSSWAVKLNPIYYIKKLIAVHALLSSSYLYPSTLLSLFIYTTGDLRDCVAETVKAHSSSRFDLYSFLSKEKLHYLDVKMADYQLTSSQALALMNPEVHYWIWAGLELVREGKMPADICIQILSHLAPALDGPKLNDLNNKVIFHTYKKLLLGNLNIYTEGLYKSDRHHKQRAVSLTNACEEVQSKAELKSLVTYQTNMFFGRSEGNAQSQKHHERPFQNKVEDDFVKTVVRYSDRL